MPGPTVYLADSLRGRTYLQIDGAPSASFYGLRPSLLEE